MSTPNEMFPVLHGPRLFVVPKAAAKVSDPSEESEVEISASQVARVVSSALRVTGEEAVDLEMALRTLAFLIEWTEIVGVEGLRKCAETVAEFRRETGQ